MLKLVLTSLNGFINQPKLYDLLKDKDIGITSFGYMKDVYENNEEFGELCKDLNIKYGMY